MWQVYAFIASDMIRDRQREAARERLGREGSMPGAGPRRIPAPGFLRRRTADGLRRVAGGAVSVARMAADAAARLEGRAA
jgi:hypothetical protein